MSKARQRWEPMRNEWECSKEQFEIDKKWAVECTSLVDDLIISQVNKVETPWPTRTRSICVKEGCTTRSKDGVYCCRHNVNTPKCTEQGCFRVAKRSGRLCESHFKKYTGDLKSGGIDVENQKCYMCDFGSPRELGGRCRDCIKRARLA